MYVMTLQVPSTDCLAYVFLLDYIFCGNRIAHCSANSITPESPYHFPRSGGSGERAAPRCLDHHQLTVAGEFEIKACVLLGEADWRRSN